jgi:hypothetical protein
MFKSLLSADLPRSRALTLLLVLVFFGLLAAPFLFHGARPLNTAATICVYIVLVASYDLLLGYTGIVSFAHTMFYGIGAYGVGLALASVDEPTWGVMFKGLALALLLALVLALVVGLFALRVRAIFYAMITLAVASSFALLASQLSDFTGGEDGKTFSVPELLSPGFTLLDNEVFGRAIDGKLITYYVVFFGCLALFLFLLRIVNSPFGRVLQAIRGRADGPVAALRRPQDLARLRNHDRHPRDRRDRRDGHDVRRGARRDPVHPGPELPQGADGPGVRTGVRRADARRRAASGPLDAVAGRAVHPLCLLLPDRHRRQAAPARAPHQLVLPAAPHQRASLRSCAQFPPANACPRLPAHTLACRLPNRH